MEMITSRPQERENPSPANSPNSSTNSNGVVTVQFNQPQPQTTPPVTPKPIPRSDNNPYPTTFVQADTTTFKQVVQMLTGSAKQATTQTHTQPDPSPSSKIPIPPIKSTGQKKQAFKLYERRNSLKNGLMINPSSFNRGLNPPPGFSPRQILSPSILDFPSLVLSPVTPLIEDPFNKPSPSTVGGNSSSEEDRAIAEKGFYLHPSPRAAASELQLLPLFPVTSPRVSGSSS